MGIFKNKYSEVRSGWKIALTFIMMVVLTIIPLIIVIVAFIIPEMSKSGGDINTAMLAIQGNKFNFAINIIIQNFV